MTRDPRVSSGIGRSGGADDARLHDLYRAPASGASQRTSGFFGSRPWPVYPVAVLFASPFCLFLADFASIVVQGGNSLDILRANLGSPLTFARDFFLAALWCAGGGALLFLRKIATWILTASLGLFSVALVVDRERSIVAGVVLAVVALAILYTLVLRRRGRLH